MKKVGRGGESEGRRMTDLVTIRRNLFGEGSSFYMGSWIFGRDCLF